MHKQSSSHIRLQQCRAFRFRLSAQDYEMAMSSNFTPVKVRLMTWAFSKLYNATRAVVAEFIQPTRGDLSDLNFELMALAYFIPLKDMVQLDANVVRLTQEQSDIIAKLQASGLYAQPDEQHPLVQEYIRVVNEAEAFIQSVFVMYRDNVTFRGAITKAQPA